MLLYCRIAWFHDLVIIVLLNMFLYIFCFLSSHCCITAVSYFDCGAYLHGCTVLVYVWNIVSLGSCMKVVRVNLSFEPKTNPRVYQALVSNQLLIELQGCQGWQTPHQEKHKHFDIFLANGCQAISVGSPTISQHNPA